MFNQLFNRVKDAFERGTAGDITKLLRLADTNGDGTLTLDEFMATLQRAKVKIEPKDVIYIYDFIDENKDGKLDYRELADVLRGRKPIDAVAVIAKRRSEQGLDHGYTPSELAMQNQGSNVVSFDKVDFGSEKRSVGVVDGMSSLMRKSDGNERAVKPLQDSDEHARN